MMNIRLDGARECSTDLQGLLGKVPRALTHRCLWLT